VSLIDADEGNPSSNAASARPRLLGVNALSSLAWRVYVRSNVS